MRSENMPKIALNAVKLPKFKDIKNVIAENDRCNNIDASVQGRHDFAHAQIAMWSLT